MKNSKSGYMNPYAAGFVLGLILFVSFLLTGNGLGASGGLNRVVVAIQDLVASDHVNATPYLAKMAGGDTNPWNSWLIPVIIGAIVGGAVSGWSKKRLKVETHCPAHVSSKKRLVYAVIGGTIMGFGARFARGCTSGQALSGGSVLSVGSWSFMFAMFAGAYGVAYLFRYMWLSRSSKSEGGSK